MTTRVAPTAEGVRPRSSGQHALPVQRHPVDLVRVFLGLALTFVGFLLAERGQLSVFERDVFRLVNDLPGIVLPAVWLLMQLGNLVAVPVVALLAALTRRVRMARDLALSGVVAYYAADLVKNVVGRARPGGLPVGAVLHEGPIAGLGFVSGHATVAAALATAAAPYLPRRLRRAAWALAWVVALARVYVGAHLPLDVVGGLALGWAIGSLVHWAVGIARVEPTPARAYALLSRFGLVVTNLHPAAVRARSSHPFDGIDETGRRVYVKLLEPDRLERDWVYRLYRLLAFRDVKDGDAVAPLGRQAEHEAVAALTALERGVLVPAVVLARGDSRGAVVVQEYVPGRPLDELPAGELTPALLRQVWRQVALLRQARVAHHDLVASSLLVDDHLRPWIVDFGNAETAAGDDSLAGDLAEVMVSLALCVDPRTVADTAVEVLGVRSVADALPAMAPLTLTAATRSGVRGQRSRLDELRAEVRVRCALPDPQHPEFPRVGLPAGLATAAGVVAVLAGVPALGGVGAVLGSLETGGWRWLGGALALAALGRAAGAAAGLSGVARRLALGRTYGATMAADGATVLHGRRGWRRSGARYLERAGVDPAAARRGISRVAAGAVLADVLVVVVLLALGLVEGRLTGWRAPTALLPAVALGTGACALMLLGQWLAGRHDPAAGTRGDVLAALRSWFGRRADPSAIEPGWRRARQLGWSAAAVLLEALALAAVLHAVRAGIPLLESLVVYAALHLLWAALPVTGAPGAADLVLLLVLTGLGAPLAPACATVLAFRLLTFWVPAGLGARLIGGFEHRLLL